MLPCESKVVASLSFKPSYSTLLTESLTKDHGGLINFSDGDAIPVFHPEFGRFMLEATPGKPWGIGFKDLLDVEPNMKSRLVNNIFFRVHCFRLKLTCLKESDSQGPHEVK